jgi:DNA-binding PadR family transcriptional regulator
MMEELSPSALGLMAILSERPMTGYELKKTIDGPEFIYWRDSFGSIYPNLNKMTRMGLAEKKRSDNRGRKRIVYTLTPGGLRLVREWLSMPASKRPVKMELLLKLRFAYPMGKTAVTSLLREYMDYHKSRLPDFYENLQYLEGIRDDSLQAETRRVNADFWYRLTRMLVEWSESALERMDSGSGSPD